MIKMLILNLVLLVKIQKDTILMKLILKKDPKLHFNKTGKISKLLINIIDLTKNIKKPKKVKIFMFPSVSTLRKHLWEQRKK